MSRLQHVAITRAPAGTPRRAASMVRQAAIGSLLGLASLGLAGTAEATPIQYSVDFSASGFGAGAPYDPLSGSFAFTADDAGDSVVEPDSVDLTIGSFVYDTTDVEVDFSVGINLASVRITGKPFGFTFPINGEDDFLLIFNLDLETFNTGIPSFFYTTDDTSSIFSGTTSVTVATPSVAVPEPSTLMLLGTFLAAMGIVTLPRRRRQTDPTAAAG